MIAAALLLLQLAATPATATPRPAAAATTTIVTVRSADGAVDVPVAVRNGAAVVRADILARALGARLAAASGDRQVLHVGDVALSFTPGVPFVGRGAETLPIASAPFVADGRLFLPLQVVSDVLPRAVPTLAYDADRGELRRATAAERAAADTAARRAERDRVAAAARPVEPAPVVAAPPRRAAARTVVVDAGHGGPDAGMRGPLGRTPTLREKDVTLDVAKLYADALRARGMNAVMTRTTDTLIALADRGRIANRAKGDLFVSIHVNAANPRWKNASAARGFETYFLAEAKTEDARRVAELENASERFESVTETTPADPLRFIVTDMQQNEHLRESSGFAAIVQTHLAKVLDGPNRGVKQAGFRVLVTAFMPAVLVELGFGTNPTEAAMLRDPARQRRMAGALADATVEYFRRFDAASAP